jgi:hypothetical protein
MTWNYRIIRRKDGSFGLHEVYYDAAGNPHGMTADPVGFAADADEGEQGIIISLKTALRDARNRPVLDEQNIPTELPERSGQE